MPRPDPVPAARTCWVLSNGIVGMDNQSLGLAEALGLAVTVKTQYPRAPWKYLPPQLWFAPLASAGPGSDVLAPPWPDVVIGTGRLNIPTAIAIKRASGGHVFNIRIQHPHVAFRHFDAIVAPSHDRCRGSQVIETLGAVNRVSAAGLEQARARWAPVFAHLPRPLVAVLLGGPNKAFRFDAGVAEAMARELGALRAAGASLALTPSRRTGAELEALFRARLAPAGAWIWDGRGDNPYLGLLALADHILVTADSVNMVSEACYTGKPVQVLALPGGSAKFSRFHDAMRQGGYTRPFRGQLETWSYSPLREAERAAAEILRRMAR